MTFESAKPTQIVAIIPARLASTRLPRKVLADIGGQPLIWHVWRRVRQAKEVHEVFIATDSPEVRFVAEGFGGKVLMTSTNCRSGTERIVECLDYVDAEYFINVQGDEPMIDPYMLDTLVVRWQELNSDLITPIYCIQSLEELLNPNVVKVVRASNGQALYFSRSPIPYIRDVPQQEWLKHHTFWAHIGVYGYRRHVLEAYHSLPNSSLEQAERLEQLRFIEAGFRFQTVETQYRPVAVDTPEDLELVRKLLGA